MLQREEAISFQELRTVYRIPLGQGLSRSVGKLMGLRLIFGSDD